MYLSSYQGTRNQNCLLVFLSPAKSVSELLLYLSCPDQLLSPILIQNTQPCDLCYVNKRSPPWSELSYTGMLKVPFASTLLQLE